MIYSNTQISSDTTINANLDHSTLIDFVLIDKKCKSCQLLLIFTQILKMKLTYVKTWKMKLNLSVNAVY